MDTGGGNLDRSLDEILAERQPDKRGPPRGGNRRGDGGRRRGDNHPRDGVRKSTYRDEAPRNFDSEWVHDRYEEAGRQSGHRRPRSPEASAGSRLRVENLHYELTEDDLHGLFNKIGHVERLELKYDRAGRSEGVAFVTYENHRDAVQAIRDYDGANAAGQPIRLTLLSGGPGSRRNPFDSAIMPGRPLAERITVPSLRSRSLSPGRREREDEEAARKGIDRYRPGGSRSPLPSRRRESGRRPGARREGRGGGSDRGERGSRGGGSGKGGDGGGGGGRGARPKKTAEELDAEMADYFGGDGDSAPKADTAAAAGMNGDANAGQAQSEDVDMIE